MRCALPLLTTMLFTCAGGDDSGDYPVEPGGQSGNGTSIGGPGLTPDASSSGDGGPGDGGPGDGGIDGSGSLDGGTGLPDSATGSLDAGTGLPDSATGSLDGGS
ncbi:MAG: hypothetical protein M4D80_21610 [Myxococcota bacterium]|nr:hypothetical protein [Deltaproteobacteria bacterium]MDQ3337766.1 hypothetical protein [Myxococcota bacterium]